jgi:integrase
MTKTYLMTWVESQKRWTKWYRGTTHSVSPKKLGCPVTKTGSADAANDWWTKKQAELDEKAAKTKPGQERYEKAISLNRQIAEWFREHLHEHEAYKGGMEEARAKAAYLQRVLDTQDDLPEIDDYYEPLHGVSQAGYAVWQERFARHDPEVPREKTVGAWVARWTERQRVAQIASDRYMKYQYCINYFRDWLGADREVTDIDSGIMEDYHGHLLGLVKQGKASSTYCKERLDTAKQFCRWLYERDLIPLPKNIANNKTLRIKIEKKEPKGLKDIAPVKTLLADPDLPERTRLYLYLMANCGMYPVDVSTLRTDQVDWKRGRITRKRTKTEEHKDVPTVTYKLWPATAALLRKYRAVGEAALTNEDGGPLQRKWIDDAGKAHKTCNITSAVKRAIGRLGLDLSITQLRKTSADLLYNHPTYRPWYQLFLGHSPRTVGEIYYARPNDTTLDEAIQWLGTQYGIK